MTATVNKSTVGTGGDYATLDLWETGEAKNCVTADVIERAALLNEAHDFTFAMNSGAWVTDPSHYILISADDGAEHNGIAGTGARLAPTSGSHVLSISLLSKHVKYSSLEITTATPTAHQAGFFTATDSAQLVFDRMMFHGFTIANGRGLWFNAGDVSNAAVANCLFFNMTFRAIIATGVTNNHRLRVYNCTFDRTAIAINIDNFTTGTRDYDLRNNVMEGGPAILNSKAGNLGWSPLCNKNITDDASPTNEDLPGDFQESVTFQTGTGGSGTRIMFDAFTPGSENYRLSATSDDNVGLDYGDNLTGHIMPLDLDLAFDIAGNPRPATGAWDAGCFETTAPTVQTSTVGTDSDYATLDLFETGEVGSLFPNNIIARAAMKDEIHTSAHTMAGAWVTDALRYIWIDGARRHDGTAGSGSRLITASGFSIILGVTADVHVTWLEISTAAVSGGGSGILQFTNPSNLAVDKCIIHGFVVGTQSGIILFQVGGALLVVNSVFYNIEAAGLGISAEGNTATVQAYNNTFHNVGHTAPTTDTPISIGSSESATDVDLRNNLLASPIASIDNVLASPADAWNAGCDQNIASDSKPSEELLPGDFLEDVTFQAGTDGSGVRVMFTSITGGAEDYHIVRDDDNAAIEYGNNLTALAATLPSNISLDVDIDGKTRSTIGAWDAGAHGFRLTSTSRTLSASRRRMMTMQAAAVGATDIIEVTGLPADFPHNFLSAQFYNSDGDQIVPTAGTILLEIETVSGSPNFEAMIDGVVDARDPATLTWAANTHSLRATPTGLEDGGVNSWRIVATFNRT